jgi:hypothetical protein
MEEGKEFELHNKLYDVSKIEKTKTGFQIYCVNDSIEESFIAMIDQLKKNNSPSGKIKIILQPQFCNRFDFENMVRNKIDLVEISFLSSFYNSPSGKSPSPPPKFHS